MQKTRTIIYYEDAFYKHDGYYAEATRIEIVNGKVISVNEAYGVRRNTKRQAKQDLPGIVARVKGGNND